MNLKEFDSTEPLCRFGPGGDFSIPWPADKPNRWVNLVASTNGLETKIVIILPFIMTTDELHKVTSDLHEATTEVSTKYLGPCLKKMLIDLA